MHPLVEHTGLDPALPVHPLMGGAGAREWDLASAQDLLLMASPRPRARERRRSRVPTVREAVRRILGGVPASVCEDRGANVRTTAAPSVCTRRTGPRAGALLERRDPRCHKIRDV